MNARLVAVDAALECLASVGVDGRHIEWKVALLASLHVRLKDLLQRHCLLDQEIKRVVMDSNCTESPGELSLKSLLVLRKGLRHYEDFLLSLSDFAHDCVLFLFDGGHHDSGL